MPTARPGPDPHRAASERNGGQPTRRSGRNVSDQPEYGDSGADDTGSFGGVPREFPHPQYPPHWIGTDSVREGGPKGYRRSDERIREDISDRLMTHPDIDPSDIEVTVSNGVVTLSGTAEDRHEKRLAEYIAQDALGVDDVENQLKVRHGLWARLTGEHATERQLPAPPAHEAGTASREGGRASSARNAAMRDASAR